MRVSLRWLRELVPFHSAPEELAERLSLAGFEVEADEDLEARARGVVVGRVVSRDPHPAADRLSVCRVDVGDGDPLQIVCGAPNVRQDMAVAVALVGSHLPSVDLTIKPASLRGVESHGMLCSLAELGLASESSGLVDLAEVAAASGLDLPPAGRPVGPLLGLDDRILELAITANRPDGLSMLGIAREVAALESVLPTPPEVPAGPAIDGEALAVAPPDGVRIALTRLAGMTVGPSPTWLQRRLEMAGVRSINTVVDITNLVMLETGQPLHAYDGQRLPAGDGSGFAVRAGRSGETLQTLDDQQRLLGTEQLLITHGDLPVALAGVIGGLETAVDGATTEVVLESAVFPPAQVRRSARGLGLRTEASARFERGVAAAATLGAADRAVALLQQLCGATVQDRRWSGPAPTPAAAVGLRRGALDRLLGPLPSEDDPFAAIPDDTVVATLERLGCGVNADDEGWQVTPPPSRAQDLQREVDLIEEVARLIGYDRFGLHLPDPVEPGGLDPSQAVLRRLRAALRSQGLQELCHLSLVPTDEDRGDQVCLHNPLLAETSALRQELLPALLQAAVRNLQASRPGFWGFEIGHCFVQTPDGPRQELRLAAVLAGQQRSERWTSSGHDRQPDYWQARGIVAAAMAEIGLSLQDRRLTDDPLLHPGRAASLALEGRPLGRFGALHPAEAERLDLPGVVHVLDLAIDPLLKAATRPSRLIPTFAPYPLVPASERDLAFVVRADLEASAVLQQLTKTGGQLLEAVDLLDRYTGSPIPNGSCSLAVRLRFRDRTATLTDEQVDPVLDRLRQMLVERFHADLRS